VNEREFSLAQARDTLETIREDVDALRAVQRDLRAVKADLTALNRVHLNNGRMGQAHQRSLRQRQRALGEAASRLITSIHATGAVIKGIDDGLVDFPGVIDGVRGYWCWKAGESAIDWWHPRGTGFADRRPLPDGAA
jgi:hypothetical protein